MQLHSKAYRISILDCIFWESNVYCNAFDRIVTMFFFCFAPAGCVQARLAYVEAQGELKVPFKDALPTRAEQLSALRNTEEFDVLVVGGGATGSGCALDAVTRSMYCFWQSFAILTVHECVYCAGQFQSNNGSVCIFSVNLVYWVFLYI